MLALTPEQFEAFEEFHMNKFHAEMLAHFAEHFPERTAHLDKEVFSKYIEDCIEEAMGYGLTKKVEIIRFLNIKVVMKAKVPFDKDEHGWAVDILRDKKALREPEDRLKKLGDMVDAELERMEGGK